MSEERASGAAMKRMIGRRLVDVPDLQAPGGRMTHEQFRQLIDLVDLYEADHVYNDFGQNKTRAFYSLVCDEALRQGVIGVLRPGEM